MLALVILRKDCGGMSSHWSEDVISTLKRILTFPSVLYLHFTYISRDSAAAQLAHNNESLGWVKTGSHCECKLLTLILAQNIKPSLYEVQHCY